MHALKFGSLGYQREHVWQLKTTTAPARLLRSPQTTTFFILPYLATKSSDRGDKFRKIKKSGEYRMILRHSPDLFYRSFLMGSPFRFLVPQRDL